MRIRLLLAATAAVTLAACSEAPTAPHKLSPNHRVFDGVGITCRSGYHIATREDGSEYCEADAGQQSIQGTSTSTSSKQ